MACKVREDGGRATEAKKVSDAAPEVTRPGLSLILPCYNGEPYIVGALGRLLRFLDEHSRELPTWEILLVDDGSTDRTTDIVARQFPRVQVLRNAKNRGKGAVVRQGMLAARGDFRIFIDADMPFDLSALLTMFRYLDFKEFDVCIGTRALSNVNAVVKRSLLRKTSSWLFTAIISRLVVTGIRDTQCGMKGFRAHAAEYLFGQSIINGFAFDVEVLYLAYKNDFDIKRIAVNLISDDNSTVSVMRTAIPMLLSVLALPIRWYTGRYRLRANLPTQATHRIS